MNIEETKIGDKVWIRGTIDEDGDFVVGNKSSWIFENELKRTDSGDIKLDEEQKPEIPQFVADWIEEHKQMYGKWDEEDKSDFVFRAINDLFRFGADLSTYDFDVDDEFSEWTTKNAYKFITAILFGYTVEKEKLYTVEIPNPNAPIGYHSKLAKNLKGEIVIEVQEWMNRTEYYQLTEQEIRKDFDWAWQWAEEVTE
ncbi:DUF1642 domain-containing protein [Streptococcus agalactiae]|uniref:DUF1642 domain-containing protein n=1 Tax=Streptococcus agalactiae TaxID=1311 RepID=UPI00083EBEEF|nr:DUF1642 domain-containing protein [Streptococcus agalactiae]MBY5043777.1 DUF1642 domain-containing protein [Streptococcus agalactiae]MBY5047239.1 DUF1642 domain-containing protein [Streptococcus agalactiae]MBY5057568.1 DUF1642 domain-containing protein [Streptococcus agalactiae]ODG95454.1 hypothetical protein TH70_0259 [Streptococcus agalactiae]